MVLNYIWIAFFLIAFVFGIVALLTGDMTIFQKMVDATFDSSKTAFETSLGLTGVLALWLGIMKVGEKAGIVNVLARMLSPFFTKLFPDIPKNHPVMGSIFMNIASNMLGLDNAATPTGLKAMSQMQELNTQKDTATNPMIMFLVLNTSGLTIIPTTILALKRLVDFYPKIYAIVFCRTKVETQEIADKLIKDGYNAESLHGDLSQQQRDLTMQKFRSHLTQILVATDVAARGLDVNDLTHVINYGLPDDIENYTHRSGRTGRAGKKGTSISIIHSREKYKVRNIEREIGKEFVDGTLPSPEEICKKQLFKSMDDILKTDVDEDQIAPYMKDITRQFEYIDKEDIIKKIVTSTFGRFLNYYKNAPEIEKPSSRSSKEENRSMRGEGRSTRSRGPRKPESGYKRLFVNLGKADGFYPGEVMQFINKNMHGHQAVGHIDLLSKQSYIEVPERDAQKVMHALDGTTYKGRKVRCNDAEEGGHGRNSGRSTGGRGNKEGRSERRNRRQYDDNMYPSTHKFKKDDWKELMKGAPAKLKGEEPDFSEEGWARRRPKK